MSERDLRRFMWFVLVEKTIVLTIVILGVSGVLR